MPDKPASVNLSDIGDLVCKHLGHKDNINCYIGSNAATPTASIHALTQAIKSSTGQLPFMKMIHILLHGPVPYVEEGLQDRVKAYSIFSGGEVREAADKGLAYYLPCTLANTTLS